MTSAWTGSLKRSGDDILRMTGLSANLATAMATRQNATSIKQSMTSSCLRISVVALKVVESAKSANTSPLVSIVTAVSMDSSDLQASFLMPTNLAHPVTALTHATLATVLLTRGSASAKRHSEGLKTAPAAFKDFTTIRTASRVPAFLMELWLMTMVFQSVQVAGRNYSALVKTISEEHSVMNVPQGFTISLSVHLVNVILKHLKMKFVTQKMASADAKHNMARELVKNVTMGSTTTRSVFPAIVMQRVL